MKIRVFVIDNNKEQINNIKNYFNNNKNIEIVGNASNGKEAIKVLKDKKIEFDIMILDIVIPIIDGFGVLEYMKEVNINKKVIILTSFNEEATIRKSSEYGVKYYALKPFDMERLESIILSLFNYSMTHNELFELKGIHLQVTNILHSLGIPSHIKGYQYIKSAIIMIYNNPSFVGRITKKIYNNLSNDFNTSIARVERSIRHAIEISCLRGDIDLMEEIFGHSIDINKAKPTNSEFIVTIADKLRLDLIK